MQFKLIYIETTINMTLFMARNLRYFDFFFFKIETFKKLI